MRNRIPPIGPHLNDDLLRAQIQELKQAYADQSDVNKVSLISVHEMNKRVRSLRVTTYLLVLALAANTALTVAMAFDRSGAF